MDTAGRDRGERQAREELVRSVAALTGEPYERRHEALMDMAETDLGIERPYAEEVYALAEEEQLEPILAFQLIRAGIGVRELETPEQDMEEQAVQQAPPDWVAEDTVELDDVALERRLRASFRRLRSHMDTAGSAEEAVSRFLEEPDVGLVRLRGKGDAAGG